MKKFDLEMVLELLGDLNEAYSKNKKYEISYNELLEKKEMYINSLTWHAGASNEIRIKSELGNFFDELQGDLSEYLKEIEISLINYEKVREIMWASDEIEFKDEIRADLDKVRALFTNIDFEIREYMEFLN